MNSAPQKLSLCGWDARYDELRRLGLREPAYGGTLRRHLEGGRDFQLEHLQFDNSPAALRLWNFLLTENSRLHQARARGEKIVGAMKDLGTVPVLACALPGLRAFYPDGTWWTPCLMAGHDQLLPPARATGIDASFCPVRALLPAFLNGEQFPRPDLLLCSTGAICDDLSAIAQRLEHLGHPILWWEMPRRRPPYPGEKPCRLPGNLIAPQLQVDCVRIELRRIAAALGQLAGRTLNDEILTAGIQAANQVRRLLTALRNKVYTAPAAPLPALEMLLAEMLAIHFCSDHEETIALLGELLTVAQTRSQRSQFVIPASAIRVFWVNPVADLRAMNLLEELGGRICCSDFMFTHTLDLIPEDLPPLEALARTALADPMAGSTTERAQRIARDCRANGAEGVIISRISGASHCAREGGIIREEVQRTIGLPVIELEIPPEADAMLPALRTQLKELFKIARLRRT